MTSTRTRRGAALAVLAVTVSSGIALAATYPAAANVAPRAHTSLSIRVARPAINPGGTDVVMGDLAARHHRVAGRAIYLEAKPQGATGWTREARHRTGRHGRVAFRVSPATSTRYRLAFLGNGLQRPTLSGVVGVRVRTSANSLAISQDAISIEPGSSDAIHGVLTVNGAPLGGVPVELRDRPAGQRNFHLFATSNTASDGTVSFPVTPAVNTHYVLIYRGTATTPHLRSAVVTVHVRRPSSLSIRALLNAAGMEVISGDLRGGGSGLAHRPVSLQQSPSTTGTWTTVGTERTGRHGGVAFKEVRPTASEDYRLVFAGGPNFDGCMSPVATVTVSG